LSLRLRLPCCRPQSHGERSGSGTAGARPHARKP
jgi:hypothetical protein